MMADINRMTQELKDRLRRLLHDSECEFDRISYLINSIGWTSANEQLDFVLRNNVLELKIDRKRPFYCIVEQLLVYEQSARRVSTLFNFRESKLQDTYSTIMIPLLQQLFLTEKYRKILEESVHPNMFIDENHLQACYDFLSIVPGPYYNDHQNKKNAIKSGNYSNNHENFDKLRKLVYDVLDYGIRELPRYTVPAEFDFNFPEVVPPELKQPKIAFNFSVLPNARVTNLKCIFNDIRQGFFHLACRKHFEDYVNFNGISTYFLNLMDRFSSGDHGNESIANEIEKYLKCKVSHHDRQILYRMQDELLTVLRDLISKSSFKSFDRASGKHTFIYQQKEWYLIVHNKTIITAFKNFNRSDFVTLAQ